MKKMRKIIPAFAMLMVAAIMMSTASFAWFSLGTTATATNMQIQAQADSSLVISLDATTAAFLTADASVEFAAATNVLTPATHDDTYDYGLKTITNATEAVDPSSGKAPSATFGNVTKNTHFVDYIVYIASAGGDLPGKNLTVTVNASAITEYLHNAITIDFLVATTKSATPAYVDSINVVEAKETPTKELTLTNGVTIPEAAREGDAAVRDYFTVIMRVYFDGDLEEGTTGKNYVRNAMVTELEAVLGVNFAAVTPTP